MAKSDPVPTSAPEVATESWESRVLSCIALEDRAWSVAELAEFFDDPDKRKVKTRLSGAVLHLTKRGKLKRTGSGTQTDPYQYALRTTASETRRRSAPKKKLSVDERALLDKIGSPTEAQYIATAAGGDEDVIVAAPCSREELTEFLATWRGQPLRVWREVRTRVRVDLED
jgi:hypothetical protein